MFEDSHQGRLAIIQASITIEVVVTSLTSLATTLRLMLVKMIVPYSGRRMSMKSLVQFVKNLVGSTMTEKKNEFPTKFYGESKIRFICVKMCTGSFLLLGFGVMIYSWWYGPHGNEYVLAHLYNFS